MSPVGTSLLHVSDSPVQRTKAASGTATGPSSRERSSPWSVSTAICTAAPPAST